MRLMGELYRSGPFSATILLEKVLGRLGAQRNLLSSRLNVLRPLGAYGKLRPLSMGIENLRE